MARQFVFSTIPKTLPNPNPDQASPSKPYISIFASQFSTNKTPKTNKSKLRNHSRNSTRRSSIPKLVQSESHRVPQLELLAQRDAFLRFLTHTKSFLMRRRHPHHSLPLAAAAPLHRELGFPRGRNPLPYILRHPLLLLLHSRGGRDSRFGFTPLMEDLVAEERSIADSMEADRVTRLRKLLMLSANNRIDVSKVYNARPLFGIPEDFFRDRVVNYPDFFRLVAGDDGRRVLELVNWDPSLAVSALELDCKGSKKSDFPSSVSPYSDCSLSDVWSPEGEKYRVGVLHEFLSLTLEKRASVHDIVLFNEELGLRKDTYQMLLKLPKTFYLAGTEMNWVVFLRGAYREDGVLIYMDPQAVFNEKFYKYAEMREMG